jgi:hypothetical protein
VIELPIKNGTLWVDPIFLKKWSLSILNAIKGGKVMSPNAKDITPTSEWFKACSVGRVGTGKSIFGSTFSTPGFMFDFSGQAISYMGLDFDYEEYQTSALNWTKFEKDMQKVISGKYYEEKKGEKGQYQTIILDDLTGMGDLALARAMQLDPKRSSTDGPMWNVHYQMQRNLMEGRLKQIFDIPANILFIMHLEFITDQETGAILGTEPLIVGQLSTRIPAMFSEVYYHITRRVEGKTKFLIQTVPIGYFNGRSKISGKAQILPDLLPNDYNEVIAYASGKKRKAVPIVPQPVVQQPKSEK